MPGLPIWGYPRLQFLTGVVLIEDGYETKLRHGNDILVESGGYADPV
ncbi:MAG: hypothetical protein H8E35_06420 [Ardenticatenia bacterium]|nr:hypothetical protein [Ardenticatenia bacterium]